MQKATSYDLGPVPDRITVELDQVRQLVREQLPQWAALPVTAVADGGWDNWTFRLGPELVVRLPSAAEYATAVEKEQQWLPVLARQLPLPVPEVLAHGNPGAGYPFVWSVYGWITGNPRSVAPPADQIRFAQDLAAFITALRGVATGGGPQPGVHNWFRGGPLQTYDDSARTALAGLEGRLDLGPAAEMWAASLAAPWDGTDRWFHGDLTPGNLVLREGRLAAVIDFGTCGVGDPACDLAAAWTLLTSEARRVFRDALAVDDAEWERGRGWALWKTLVTCHAAGADGGDTPELTEARRVLDEILDEAG